MLALLTPLISGLITALPSLAPVLVQVGLWAFGKFASNEAQKQANQKAFLDAISAHMNDSLQSVNERSNAWAQIQELRAKAKARDEAAKS